jgi:hypothetical protein
MVIRMRMMDLKRNRIKKAVVKYLCRQKLENDDEKGKRKKEERVQKSLLISK